MAFFKNHKIDEEYVTNVTKKALSLSEPITAQILNGGLTSALLFIVTSDLQKYVVRFIKHRSLKERELEISSLKTASKGGYGPRLYFADPSQGVVIMEYVPGKIVSAQDLPANQFYGALARLLQKIHRGPKFEHDEGDIFKVISKDIQFSESKYYNYAPFTKFEKIFNVIHKALLPHLITVPCHNDLHKNNLLFWETEFRAVDYEDAGQNDPYYDVSMATISFCLNSTQEKILLSTYLNYKPSNIEEAKLYLMKQIVLIWYAFRGLIMLPSKNIYRYHLVKFPSIDEFARNLFDGTANAIKPENLLKNLDILFNSVFENFESQEFRDAVKLLNK